MKPFKIEKTVVQAKSRTLKATWTFENVQDASAQHGIDLDAELSKILAEEIRREQIKEMCERLLWTKVVVNNWQRIDKEWCKKYIKHKYQALDSQWYFEDERDAAFFSLKWGSAS